MICRSTHYVNSKAQIDVWSSTEILKMGVFGARDLSAILCAIDACAVSTEIHGTQ